MAISFSAGKVPADKALRILKKIVY